MDSQQLTQIPHMFHILLERPLGLYLHTPVADIPHRVVVIWLCLLLLFVQKFYVFVAVVGVSFAFNIAR